MISKKVVPKKKLLKHHRIKSKRIYQLNKKDIDERLRHASRSVTAVDDSFEKVTHKELAERLKGKYPLKVCSIDPGNRAMGFRLEVIKGPKRTEVLKYRILSIDDSVDVYEKEMIKLIKDYKIYHCDLVVVEKQVGMNKQMIRFETILRAMMFMIYSINSSKSRRHYIQITSTLKTKLMVNNHDDKKTVTYHVARDILSKMGDERSLKVLDKYREDNTKNKKHRSDLSDAVCQVYALLYSLGVVDLF